MADFDDESPDEANDSTYEYESHSEESAAYGYESETASTDNEDWGKETQCLDADAREDAARARWKAAQRYLGGSESGAKHALRAHAWDLAALKAARPRDSGGAGWAAAGTGECEVCYDDAADLWRNACGHAFCQECWRGHAEADERLDATCPAHGCPEKVPDEAFDLSEGAGARRRRLWADSLVDDGPGAWCPRGCGRAVLLGRGLPEGPSGGEASCLCLNDARFCARCGGDAHAPVACGPAAEWTRLLEDRADGASGDPAAVVEEVRTVKRCPKPRCGCVTEKDGGCNYMTCRSCSEHWCWHCGAWGGGPSGRPPPHHLFLCNEPETGFAALRDDGRVAWYGERSKNHEASRQFAVAQRDRAARRAARIVEGSDDPDALWVLRAARLVERCRGTLAWSYAHAFLEPDDDKRHLFACAQTQLEKFTEELSGLTEQKAPEVAAAKTRVVFLTAALAKYRANVAEWTLVVPTEPYKRVGSSL